MRDKVLVVETIKLMRGLLRIKQADIANFLKITRSAYNQFESMRASLSIDNIYAICEFLKINKDWLDDNSDIFLKSRDILFLEAKTKEVVHKFLATAKKCSYLHIFIPDTTVRYLVSKILLKELVITVIHFENDTFCILRTPALRSTNDFYDYFESMYKVLEDVNIPFSYSFLENFERKKEILEKINDKKVTIDDLKDLYSLSKAAKISLSLEEKELIQLLREHKISATHVKNIIFDKTHTKP